MYGLAAVLRHGLKASERPKLGLRRKDFLYRLGSERSDQLVLKIEHAGEEPEGVKGLEGGQRNCRVDKCPADVALVGNVVDAADLCSGVHA